MNKQKNKSKSGGRMSVFSDTGYGNTDQEKHKDRADRIAANKKNSRKKALRAKHAKPKDTPKLVANEIASARESARTVFEWWLMSPEVDGLLHKSHMCRRLIVGLVSAYLWEDVKDSLEEVNREK
jgi:hypothetical protein